MDSLIKMCKFIHSSTKFHVEQFPKIVDKCLIKFIVLMNVLNMMKMIFCRSAYNVMKGVEI